MKMKKLIAMFAIMAALLPAVAGAQEQVVKDTLLRANTDTLMKHIRVLSNSQYEGRMAGSQAYLEAADYVAEVLSSYGVKPWEGEWAQWFEVEYNEIENCNFYTYVNDNDTRMRYVLGRDYVCSSMTGRGYTNAPVVFCGWGIDNRVFNEYAQVDAQGKIVLCLSGVPEFLPGNVTSQYATLRQRPKWPRSTGPWDLSASTSRRPAAPTRCSTRPIVAKGRTKPPSPWCSPQWTWAVPCWRMSR